LIDSSSVIGGCVRLTFLHIFWRSDFNSNKSNITLIDTYYGILSYRQKYMTTTSDGVYKF
jgi:hypothetical protein